jgi:hypothetical protein
MKTGREAVQFALVSKPQLAQEEDQRKRPVPLLTREVSRTNFAQHLSASTKESPFAGFIWEQEVAVLNAFRHQRRNHTSRAVNAIAGNMCSAPMSRWRLEKIVSPG